jgi:hypothetical protein
MSGLIHSIANPTAASPKTRAKRDSSQACRDRASADLLKSVTMLTANERLVLERSAASWGVRAEMLEGLERSAAQPRLATRSSKPKGADNVRI